MKMRLVVLGIILGLCAFAPSANAAMIQYDFTAANFTGGPTSPFGTVTLTDTVANTVRIDVNIDDPMLMIQDAFGFNSGANLTLGAVSSPYYSGWDSTGQGNMDGFGRFRYILDGPTYGSGHAVNDVTFYVSGTGITAQTLFQANTSGHMFASHVYVAPGCTGFISDGTGNTSGGSCTSQVPEPTSMLLFGAGLLGLGLLRRHRS